MKWQSYIQERSMLDPESGCWIWQGGYAQGYGQATVNRHPVKAHRLSYWAYKGETLAMMLMHRCNNKGCVNPEHLEEGNASLNTAAAFRDGLAKPSPTHLTKHLGSAHGRAKITEKDVTEIRRLYDCGLYAREIAVRFKISRSQVANITRGHGWKHVK